MRASRPAFLINLLHAFSVNLPKNDWTLHVRNLVPIFRRLRRPKEFVRDRGPCVTFRNIMIFFTVKSF
jgi:hypothetical protein